MGLTLGTLTASLIQAGASARLDGVHGLAGWRWMYIICAIITIPIGILGFIVLPGTPEKPNKLILNEHDVAVAKARLKRDGHGIDPEQHSDWRIYVNILRSRKFWLFLWLASFFWNGCYNTNAGGYLLWLKSLGRYSTSRVNELNAIAPALGIFYTLLICFASDLLIGPAWAITVAHTYNSIGLIIQVIWTVPESALWFAFSTTYSSVSMSSVLYGWINSELRYSPVQRSVALVVINTVAQSTTIWTPLLVFKTVEGPQFTKGYSFVLACAICTIITPHVLRYAVSRNECVCHYFIPSVDSFILTINSKKHRDRDISEIERVVEDPEAVDFTDHAK